MSLRTEKFRYVADMLNFQGVDKFLVRADISTPLSGMRGAEIKQVYVIKLLLNFIN